MSPEIILTTFLAGMLYVLIPGPATLAALSLSATDGRAACVRFLGCHLVGDLMWSAAAILAIVGVSQLGPALFDTLGLICGLYLIYLGINALRSPSAGNTRSIKNPWRSGLLFGLTNPKAYPFALTMFTAVFSRFDEAMSLSHVFPLVAAAFSGFLVATGFVVLWTGLPITRKLFLRYGRWITRATGLVFIAFGAKSIVDAVNGFRARATI
ncbi:Threonine/homoserine/homoserine lactone efflux protein [Aliiroseovarius sediminilitoris]|uniref:Threonine/homoserine/homoserine lactone efflux protein n=1 Tax=Aliiroseovarius sediminilitoris TaxID=1173584 RepID=A0A1I0NT69_9RHOB|nr:LysE family translocator [Aliiroseovarius sediminilitoris]SEW04842.1 Threonine/homoserine/homoserine lactone efflux protein [Aliiroseovarius sediminilitoris]